MWSFDRSGIRASAGTRSRSAAAPLTTANTASSTSAIIRGSGTWFAAPERLKNPLLSGARLGAADVDGGGLVLAAGDRREVTRVLSAGGSLAGRIGGPHTRTASAGAPVGAALDGGGDDFAAVGVLVGVGREVVPGLAQLGVGVLAVELAVNDAVAQHLIGARHGRGGRDH